MYVSQHLLFRICLFQYGSTPALSPTTKNQMLCSSEYFLNFNLDSYVVQEKGS